MMSRPRNTKQTGMPRVSCFTANRCGTRAGHCFYEAPWTKGEDCSSRLGHWRKQPLLVSPEQVRKDSDVAILFIRRHVGLRFQPLHRESHHFHQHLRSNKAIQDQTTKDYTWRHHVDPFPQSQKQRYTSTSLLLLFATWYNTVTVSICYQSHPNGFMYVHAGSCEVGTVSCACNASTISREYSIILCNAVELP